MPGFAVQNILAGRYAAQLRGIRRGRRAVGNAGVKASDGVRRAVDKLSWIKNSYARLARRPDPNLEIPASSRKLAAEIEFYRKDAVGHHHAVSRQRGADLAAR